MAIEHASGLVRSQPRSAVAHLDAPAVAAAAEPRRRVDRRVTRVLIVDGQRAFGEALALVLGLEPGLEVAAPVVDAQAAIGAVRRDGPDVVIVDVDLPDLDGLELASRLVAEHPEMRVVVLSNAAPPEQVARAAAAGASAFLHKKGPIQGVIDAVRHAAHGPMRIDGDVLQAVIRQARDRQKPTSLVEQAGLTSREADVLRLLVEGLDPKTIARELGISLHTTRGYLKTMRAKLGVHSQVEAVSLAVRRGMAPDRRLGAHDDLTG